ncbi:MAG: GUN4 domain-containing protein [Cyanobacteria bacterium P01_D01_bin.50]
MYQNLGGTLEYNPKVWKNFGDRVGWTSGGDWLRYNQYTFEINAHKGHLPSKLGAYYVLRIFNYHLFYFSLAQKLVECNI